MTLRPKLGKPVPPHQIERFTVEILPEASSFFEPVVRLLPVFGSGNV